MDWHPLLIATNAIALLILFFLCKLITSKIGIQLKNKPLQAPKPKGAWPTLGHLPLLAVPIQTYRTLGAMADEYGPVLTMKLGLLHTVVVSGKEAIKECFTTNDNAFISRPDTYAVKHLGYNAVVPILGWLDLQGRVRSMKQTAKEVDYFMSTWLEEHIKERQNHKIPEQNVDFVHVMLSLFAEVESIEGYDKKAIKAMIQVFILAGSETPVITMIWALALLLNHKEKLTCVQEELDLQVGRDKWVQESDINNLPYLIAIVKETMRLYPSGPLSVPRESISDCYVSGYYVPKGTVLVTNIWKLHRDPNTWTDPNDFIPERFLTSNNLKIDGRGQYFEYLPFGTEKRMCPGVLCSLQIVYLTLARVLQGYNFATYMNTEVDMREGMSIALSKATPLEVLITPRLPIKLY